MAAQGSGQAACDVQQGLGGELKEINKWQGGKMGGQEGREGETNLGTNACEWLSCLEAGS